MNPVRLDPQGPFMRDPLAPHQMRDRLTRTQDLFILCHLGVPRIERDRWSLTIDGMVERPSTLRFDDLVRYPKTEVATIHQCCGSPLKPFEPRRRVCNVRWSGVRLVDVLADCRPRSAAQYIWSYGADSGEFSGVVVDPYLKDLPIARVEDDVLIAYEMNGSALPAEHGFPARLVVPGFYGTNSVKWLTRMSFVESRAQGPFTTRWYNDPVLDGTGRETGKTTPSGRSRQSRSSSRRRPMSRSSYQSSGKYGVGPGRMAGFVGSRFAPPTRRRGDPPSSSRRADASGSAFRCPGRRGNAVQWCWLREPRQWVGWSSRYRGGATQSMRWR